MVVGQYYDEDGRVHSTLFADGVHQSIDVPGALGTQAFGINSLGQVVGTFVADPAENQTPFMYANGVHAPLALPGALALPLDINDHGVVVGTTYDPSFAFTLGFVSGPTGSQLVRYAAAMFTTLDGINNSGEAVGLAESAPGAGSVSVRYKDGTLSLLNPVDGAGCYIVGISDAADLVGGCADGTGYLFSGQAAQRFTYGSDLTTGFNKISASGTIVGWSTSGAFLVLRSKLVDPVPDLLDGPAVTTAPSALASEGRPVQGAAADGVARVVVRIPAATAGQQFMVRLLNDHEPRALSTSDEEDGALATVAAQTSWVSQLTVTAEGDTGATPMAFVTYRAPEDFPRAGTPVAPGAFGPDDFKSSRQVLLEITPQGQAPYVQVVEIVRPPVMLVHGIWSNADSWRFFSPLATGADPRFATGRADYSNEVDVVSTVPTQPDGSLTRVRANSLGLGFNASKVDEQAQRLADAFSKGANPLGMAVASAQVDFVGHSMGGVVVRTLAMLPANRSPERFGAGLVHKLVTMNTPHLGSPMATRLLQSDNTCLRSSLVDLEINEIVRELVAVGDFAVTGDCVARSPIAPGASCAATVTYTPTRPGTVRAVLQVGTTLSSIAEGVPLFGEGLGLRASNTTLGSSTNPSVFGQPVTLTATVTDSTGGGTPAPTGEAAFLSGTTSVGSAALVGAGTATSAISGLAVGSHVLTASYSGDSAFGPSTSAPLTQVVRYAAAGSVCGGGPGRQILPPINTDGTSVFRQGRTVPAKFRVCDANGQSVGTAGVVQDFRLTQVISGTTSDVNENVPTTTPDTAFRWDAAEQQWIFNISTAGQDAQKTYVYTITLNDRTTIQCRYGLR